MNRLAPSGPSCWRRPASVEAAAAAAVRADCSEEADDEDDVETGIPPEEVEPGETTAEAAAALGVDGGRLSSVGMPGVRERLLS